MTRRATGTRARAGRALLVLLVLTAAASVVWYRRLPPDEEAVLPAGPAAGDSRASMVTRDFRHVETRMDRTIWILEAASAEIFEERARLSTVKITWFGEPGAVPLVVTSRSGQLNLRNRNAILSGAVRLERADGAVLETEELRWNDEEKLLRAPRAVRITTPTFTFSGSGLNANIGQQWVKLRGRVNGEVRGVGVLARSPQEG